LRSSSATHRDTAWRRVSSWRSLTRPSDPSPAAVIASLNRILCRTGGPRSFFSCCYVLLSPNGEFTATTAGHPPILKIGIDGKIASRIGSGSYPLGIKNNLAWHEHRDAIANGERLLLHSDGLTEARNSHGREFGDSFVEAIAGWNPKASADGLVRTYVDELKLFTGGRAPEDDVSIAVISKLGSGLH
jgi:sigma-B regulation protein RsbU (phosphoserine phosphatase)